MIQTIGDWERHVKVAGIVDYAETRRVFVTPFFETYNEVVEWAKAHNRVYEGIAEAVNWFELDAPKE